MPAFTETTTFYEFLIRGDDAGVATGAHVQFRNATFRDGVKIAETVSDAQPVALADGQNGLSLQVVLGEVATAQAKQIDALNATAAATATANAEALAAKDAEIEALAASRDEAVSRLNAVQSRLDAATVGLTSLTAQLVEGGS